MRWILVPIAIVAALVVVGLLVGPSTEDSVTSGDSPPDARVADTSTSQPETISDNTANPPQADLNGDTACVTDSFGWVTAQGTLTNRSSETSMYTIRASFNDGSGVRFAEGTALHIDVRSGESVRWKASGHASPEPGWTCVVVSVERFASK